MARGRKGSLKRQTKNSQVFHLFTYFSGDLQGMEYEYPPAVLGVDKAPGKKVTCNQSLSYICVPDQKSKPQCKIEHVKGAPQADYTKNGRLRFSKTQVLMMTQEYEERKGIICLNDCRKIASNYGLEPKQLKKWFMNRKYRSK